MVFLWVFLPIVILGSLILRKTTYQNYFLLLASLIFYAWGEPKFILMLLFSIAMNYCFGLLIDRFPKHKLLFLVIDVIGNLGILGYFKYANFFLNTLDHLMPFIPMPRVNVIMPIGISFFTFQAMTYVIDLYRGQYKVQKNPLHLALYISFFPQLIAGPIVKYREIDEQILNRSISVGKFAEGVRRFLYGLGKKVIIANTVAATADTIFALTAEEMTCAFAWIGAFLYTLQIYYDFSGYSDMAIGMGKMFGFEFLENFDHPYLSRSITEFWRRWHISLGSWFREYLYIPLGGNKKGKIRTYINLFIVFGLTGLWHGASWNFVGWGLYHGFFTIVERLGFRKVLEKLKGVNWLYTFLVAMVGWIFFRVEELSYGLHMVRCMVSPQAFPTPLTQLRMMVNNQTFLIAILGFLGAGFVQAFCTSGTRKAIGEKWRGSLAEAVFLLFVTLYSIMLLANNAYNPFIYFRF